MPTLGTMAMCVGLWMWTLKPSQNSLWPSLPHAWHHSYGLHLAADLPFYTFYLRRALTLYHCPTWQKRPPKVPFDALFLSLGLCRVCCLTRLGMEGSCWRSGCCGRRLAPLEHVKPHMPMPRMTSLGPGLEHEKGLAVWQVIGAAG